MAEKTFARGISMKQKSLKLNFIMNAILTMSQFIFPLITFPYVSRILLPEGTGKVIERVNIKIQEGKRHGRRESNFLF